MIQNQELISFETLIGKLPERDRGIECIGFAGSDKAYLVSKIYRQLGTSILVIVSSAKEGERLIEDLVFFSGNSDVPILFFPPYNILPFKFLTYHNETAGHRVSVLYRLLETSFPTIVVTTVDALLQKIVPKQEINHYAELVIAGEEIDRDELIAKLIAGGYARTAIVEEPGDFCVRGGIIDIFSPLYPDPLRVEFFGDLVESIRFFSASTQRKIKDMDEAVILPAKEVIIDEASLPQIISRIRTLASELEVPVTHARSIIDQIRNDGELPGIESLIPIIYPQLDTLFDYMPQDSLVVTINPEELEKVAKEAEARITLNFNSSRAEKKLCVEPRQIYLEWPQAAASISERKPLAFKMLDVLKSENLNQTDAYRFNPPIGNNTDLSMEIKNSRDKEQLLRPLVKWLTTQKESGLTTLAVCRNQSQAARLDSLLVPYGLQAIPVNAFSEIGDDKGKIYICIGQVSSGFVWPAESLAVITDDEIFGIRHHRRKAPKSGPRPQLLELQELKQDDLIVHDDHGIGQYGGLVKLSVDGITNDFMAISYKGGDKLYLPVDRMGIVQKYMGVDGIVPMLDTLGGKSWERVKARVKKSAEKIAGELLKLYARRNVEQGYAFSPIDSEVKEFEAGFTYEETKDQLQAIEDVINDMQNPTPMDRLVCGDVGYGKTEVALRASFLTVNDGKQVAMLVPTDYPGRTALCNLLRPL